MSRRLAARWADNLTLPADPADPAVDAELAKLRAQAARFRHWVLAWLAVMVISALVWHALAHVLTLGEATGAWLGIGVLFAVVVAFIATLSRRERGTAAPPTAGDRHAAARTLTLPQQRALEALAVHGAASDQAMASRGHTGAVLAELERSGRVGQNVGTGSWFITDKGRRYLDAIGFAR